MIRASTGIFYDPPQTDQYRRAILNNGIAAFFNVSHPPGTTFAPSFPTCLHRPPDGFHARAADITTVDPDFATLYSGNANFSISRELSANYGVCQRRYLYTAGKRLPIYRNINLVPSGARWPMGGRSSAPRPGISRASANITSAESVGNSIYNGLNLTLRSSSRTGIRTLRHVYVVARHRRRAGAEQHR